MKAILKADGRKKTIYGETLEDLAQDGIFFIRDLGYVIEEDDEKTILSSEKEMEYLNNYNQVETTEKLTIPILILQGKRDYQVTYEDDYKIWNTTLNDNENVILKSYEKLNHLFIAGEGKPTNIEYLTPGYVSEDLINDIINWIK